MWCRMLRLRKRIQVIGADANLVLRRQIHRQSNFYDALGVTPKATQADIKTAFYKLSMQFHPDKATGSESKFREINAAYEILGNLKLRKLYDNGYLPNGQPHNQNVPNSHHYGPPQYPPPQYPPPQYPEDFIRNETRERRGPIRGKTDAYNYDEWTRSHYSEAFFRSRGGSGGGRVDPPPRWDARRQRQYEMQQRLNVERTMWVLFSLTFILMIMAARNNRIDWDKPQPRTTITYSRNSRIE